MQTDEQILNDISSLKIQGATNVAIAVLDALERHPDKEFGMRLAYARPTEPLAQNAVRYIFSGENVAERIAQYKTLITDAKTKIAKNGSALIKEGQTYIAHCHASTLTNALIAAHNSGVAFNIIATETRPRFQGRITATELVGAGIDVTMIVDSGAAAVIASKHIAGVLVGADVLSEHGFVNKIGTYGLALAAHAHNVPVYCFSTLLKYGPEPVIEQRSPKEIWEDAPPSLKFLAPAFDVTPYDLGVTVITEVGIVEGAKIKEAALKEYPWLTHTQIT